MVLKQQGVSEREIAKKMRLDKSAVHRLLVGQSEPPAE